MSSLRRFPVVALVAVLLAPSGAAAQTAGDRSADARAGRTDAVAQESGFWRVLGDSTLDRLMQLALRGNHELQAAAARVDGAEAARLQATLAFTPSVNATATYTRRRLANATFPGAPGGSLPDQNVWDSGLQASLELDAFGRLRGGLRARNALAGAAGEDVRAVEVALTAELARTYFDLRGAQGQLAVARRNAENQRGTLALTETRLDAGRGTELDTERARAQLSTTLAAIPLLEARIAAAHYRIAVLVARPPQQVAAELAGEVPLPQLPDSVASPAIVDVIRMRPDLRGAEDRVVASRELVRAARADYMPRISIAGAAGYTANEVDAVGGAGTFNYAIGPVISWPAFDIGRVKARVDQAQADEREARVRHEQLVLLAQEQVEATAVRYRTARARLDHLRAAAEASERAAELARLRFEGGISDFLQVLDAERTLLVAQDQLAQGRTAATEAYVDLYEARGARWPDARAGRR
jgi:outer membrane protein, multidrug efflux system